MRHTVLSRKCTKSHCRWGVQLENKKWHISASTAGNNVIGWRIWKLQCHQWDGVDAVSHQDAPSATFGDHQQYWKDLCMSDSGRQSLHCMASLILSTPFVPWFLTDLQSASSANHSLWHSKMKYWCCRFLNIQTCARCRPNFTDLCLRVTESPDEIFTALPRVPQMPKLCPRFYDRGLNLDKTLTSFGTSCKRWNCKTLRRVKSHQKFSKVSGTAVSLFDSSSRSRFLSDFMIFVNICEIFVNRKAILEIKPGRSVRAG